MNIISRREFLGMGLLALAATPALGNLSLPMAKKKGKMEVSLAEWSIHVELEKKLVDHLDFPKIAREEFGIGVIEPVSFFFKDRSTAYLNEVKKRAKDYGVRHNLIMVGGNGLGLMDDKKRQAQVEDHCAWVDVAKSLGCKAIRVNPWGEGTADQVAGHLMESYAKVSEYAAKEKIYVLVENHREYSADADWLMRIIKQVNNPYLGTLPDFGNFCLRSNNDGCLDEYDRYEGVKRMLPLAKALSAKTYDFDSNGYETTIDYPRMFQILKDFGYSGTIGIEYEGWRLPAYEAIRASKKLIDNLIKQYDF